MKTTMIRLAAAGTVAVVLAVGAKAAEAACYWWMFCECIPEWWCW